MGTAVIGNYEVRASVGQDTFGKIYQAQDKRSNRNVMLREYPIPGVNGGQIPQQTLQRLAQQVQETRTLDNQGVVPLLEGFVVGKSYFLAFEPVHGMTLRETIQLEGTLSIPKASQIIVQVARILDYLAEKGVRFCDVSPDNLYVLSDGSVKMTGFCTPGTVLPEPVGEIPLDSRLDLFSLGVTFYQMLTGKMPFQGGSLPKLIESAKNEDLTLPPGTPDYLSAILKKLFCWNPMAWYHTGSDLSEDLIQKNTPHVPQRKSESEQRPPCAFHPDRPSLMTCSRCGKPICVNCMISKREKPYCRVCGVKVNADPGILFSVLCCAFGLGGPGFRIGLGLNGKIVLLTSILSLIFGFIAMGRGEKAKVPLMVGLLPSILVLMYFICSR